MRQARTSSFILLRASLLTAGRNALNMLVLSPVRALLARNVQPGKVNDVFSQSERRRFLSLQCRVARGNLAPGPPQNGA